MGKAPPERIVTSFVRHDRKVLLVQRSGKMSSMAGLWSAISGQIEGEEDPLERAKTEVLEEAGISPGRLSLAARSGPHVIEPPEYPGRSWEIRAFLFDSQSGKVALNWENSGFAWVLPEEIGSYECVPGLSGLLAGLL